MSVFNIEIVWTPLAYVILPIVSFPHFVSIHLHRLNSLFHPIFVWIFDDLVIAQALITIYGQPPVWLPIPEFPKLEFAHLVYPFCYTKT